MARPLFRAFHALAVDDAGCLARFTLHGFATLHVERVMNAIQRAVPAPKVEIIKQRALRRQVFWNITPLASRAQHIHEAVHDFPRLNGSLASAAFGRRNKRLDACPFLVGEIARIAQIVAIVFRAVFGRPHRRPLIESGRLHGSGARSLFVTQKVGAHYQIASVMMKIAGVADAMVLPELSKSGMDDIVRQMKTSIAVVEADLACITRMLELAIADNFASGHLPPFKFVEVVENLGLGPVHPDHASPTEIITDLLADLPPDQTNPTSVAKAHADILDSEFSYQWFEAGEALEDLLYPVKGSKARIAKVIKTYLPERRLFWARQCALSALATRGNEKTRHSPWKLLALVGRDIASDLPLDQIPVMKRVAEASVRAFEGRL